MGRTDLYCGTCSHERHGTRCGVPVEERRSRTGACQCTQGRDLVDNEVAEELIRRFNFNPHQLFDYMWKERIDFENLKTWNLVQELLGARNELEAHLQTLKQQKTKLG